MDDIQIRRNILKTLYGIHQREPHGAANEEDLARKLGLSLDSFRRNVFYLSDRHFIHSERIETEDGRIFHFLSIAGTGIDLLEDSNEFNAKFPQPVIIQYVAGDYIQVTIGDNASDVIVGKNIVSVPFGTKHELQEACKLFLDTLTKQTDSGTTRFQAMLAEIEKLKHQLHSSEPDLGELQRIKEFFVKNEGIPAPNTAVFFSHPAVVEPIRSAFYRLTGRPIE